MLPLLKRPLRSGQPRRNPARTNGSHGAAAGAATWCSAAVTSPARRRLWTKQWEAQAGGSSGKQRRANGTSQASTLPLARAEVRLACGSFQVESVPLRAARCEDPPEDSRQEEIASEWTGVTWCRTRKRFRVQCQLPDRARTNNYRKTIEEAAPPIEVQTHQQKH
jgi:hypothetical protein